MSFAGLKKLQGASLWCESDIAAAAVACSELPGRRRSPGPAAGPLPAARAALAAAGVPAAP